MSLFVCTVEQIVTKPSRSLTLKLQSDKEDHVRRNLGIITIHAEETVASRSAVEIIFRCSHLDNKDILSKSVNIQYQAPSYPFYLLHS